MKKFASKIIKHPLFSGSFIMIAGSMGVNVINYVYHLIMGRVLGPVNYGVLLSLYSLLYLVCIIPMSTSVAIVKFISAAKNKDQASQIYRKINDLIMKVALVVSVVTLIFSPFVASFLRIDNVWLVVMVSVILFFNLVTLVNQATAQGLLRFMGNVAPNLVSAIAKFAIGLALVFLGWNVFGAMVGVVLGAIFSYLVSLQLIKKYLNKKNASKFKIEPFLKYSFPTLMQALAFTSFFSIDVLLVKHYLPAYDAGIYAALSTLGKIIYFAASPISGVMFPIVSGRHAKGIQYQRIFMISLVATLVISVGVVAVYWLLPKIAIGLLFGEKYLVAQKELVWMSLFISFLTLSSLLVNFFLSIGKVKIVIFPIIIAVAQVVGIVLLHQNMMQIIQVSLVNMMVLFAGLSIYLVYNQLAKPYLQVNEESK